MTIRQSVPLLLWLAASISVQGIHSPHSTETSERNGFATRLAQQQPRVVIVNAHEDFAHMRGGESAQGSLEFYNAGNAPLTIRLVVSPYK